MFLKLSVVYGQNIIDVPICEIEPRFQLFPVGWEQSLYKFCFMWVEKMSDRREILFEPIGIPTIFRETFPAKTTKMLSTRNSSILMMSPLDYLFLKSERSFTKYASSWPKTRYLYLRLPFLKMKEFRIILARLFFTVSWRIHVGCIKGGRNRNAWCLLYGWNLEIKRFQ